MALACAAARLVHPCIGMGMVSKQHLRTPPPSSCCLHLHHIIYLRPVASSHHLARHSVDVTKEDKPLEPPPPAAAAETESTQQQEDEDGGPKLDPRWFEEKFAVLNTGVHECRSCGYRYDQTAGDPSYPVPPGLPFAQLPDDWWCPTCGATQSFFESKSVEIAGFAQN
ncbi:Rubredoxin [Zea mays]|uniref:Rubredoxin n=1 Tax=Zea mays TaxID=4577 RepID=A0A3L6FI41_MAIZE|nr:Rubredoxin [Zea mays]